MPEAVEITPEVCDHVVAPLSKPLAGFKAGRNSWSFVSWVAYAAYLHARATPSVKRTTATWFAVVAWLSMLINLYVINFVAVGLHTYANVD